jgi:thioesterase domain-containing protein/acyl carrier protein/NAD(P)-dependent dehydrogenase (short-subunit alcohol dehydrogenase family)
VADKEQMRRIVAHTIKRFGALHGVIHAAGIVRAGLIQVKTKEMAASVLSPKVQGTLVLHDVLRDIELDFLALFSSITSIVWPFAESDYSGANAFLDAFSCVSNTERNYHTVTINWPGWRETGQLVKLKSLAGTERWKQDALRRAILTRDGLAVFKRAVNADFSQVIISPEDLESVLEWAKEPIELSDYLPHKEDRMVTSGLAEVRNGLLDAPRNNTEDTVARIWRNVLGVSELGTSDNFLDLGGHSLLAIKIVSELRKAFRIDLPLKALFDAPTVAELSVYIENQNGGLQPRSPDNQVCNGHKALCEPKNLLGQLRKENPKLLVEDAFFVPRWFVQQKTWFEDPSNSDSAVYNYSLLLRIRGPLDENALQKSLQEIVRRHEVLRSVFRTMGGELIQVVVPPPIQSLRMVDLSNLPVAEKDARSDQSAIEEANQPFDLACGPLLRSVLMRLGPNDHILQLTAHQIVYDDWSTGVLSRELSELYRTFAVGAASPLSELSFQYGDYVRWHEEQLQGKKVEAELSYWKAQLASVTGFEHLPVDFARPMRSSKRGERERVVLSVDLANSLKALSRQERVSLFMVLLAGFKCLLHRYSNHDEIGIGSCGANRVLAEAEGLIGRFGNTMLLRTNLAGNPTFRELLMRVRGTALTAYSKQNVPFGMLLKEGANGADPTRKPPFQVMFILQNAPQGDPEVHGLTMNWSPLYPGTAAYDLDVWLKTEPELEVVLEYRTDLFRAATIKKVLEDYQAILEEVANNPGVRIHNLLISRKAEPAQLPPPPTIVQAKIGVAPPEDDVQSRLVELWEAAFKMHPISVDQDFFELGGDSLLGARLFTQMEKTFQMELPLTALLEAPTIRQVAEIIRGRKARSSSSFIVVQPGGTKPPLFCVYGHGGGIFYFGVLSRSLGADQPVYGLRLEGFAGEDNSIEDMAAYYLREIRKIQPKGPYLISGYCFGGMVAYEIARSLQIQGEKVAFLALFNAPAPGSLKGWPYSCLMKRFTHELRKLRSLPTKEKLAVFAGKTAGLRRMLLQSFTRALWRALPQSSGAGGGQRARRVLSDHNANILAAKAYHPVPYAGRIILFVTEEIGSRYAIDPRRGWGDLAGDGIEIHPVAGDNVSFFATGNVEALAEKLRFCLARVHRKDEHVSAPASKLPSEDLECQFEKSKRAASAFHDYCAPAGPPRGV